MEHLDRINRHAADFDRSKLTDDSLRILLLLQSFCYSNDNDELKKIALRVIEENQDASFKDVVAELEAHLNVSSGLKTLENPTKYLIQKVSLSKKKNASTRKLDPNVRNKSLVANAKCNGCGGAHARIKCTFRDAICHKCSIKGHIAKVCRSSAQQSNNIEQSNNIASAEQSNSQTAAKSTSVKIYSLSAIGKRRRQYVTAFVLGNSVTLQYDTGSDITIMGKKDWIRIGSPKLISSDTVEHAGGNKLDVIGRFYCTIHALDRTGNIYINVASCDNVNLFGLDAIDSLNLWSVPLAKLQQSTQNVCVSSVAENVSTSTTLRVQSTLSPSAVNREDASAHDAYLDNVLLRFPKIFAQELGTCRDFKAKFDLVSDARSVQRQCHPIPFAMEDLLAEELSRLVSNGILERVETLNWSSPIVIAKKRDGKLRLCVDFSTGVNNAILDNKHPLPTVENIMSKLNGSCFFSLLDLSDAFFQLKINEAYREITTITIPKGLFRFKRLPFGIKTAPAIFQQAMDLTLANLPGVYAYLDDIVVLGSSQQEHDARLHDTLQRLQDRGWRFKAEKCRFALKEIKYLGWIINAHGISADLEATSAITNMPKPTTVSEVQSFLGMVNHYGKFIPHLHQLKHSLQELTRKNCPWTWNQPHDLAFEQIKKVMLSPLLLEH
ncbi:PREDICTED: uncharacterized protein K02A2.6-like [Cyphomyrmex costatus]|uniref:uncharacterized protein K02A2.6-like n=1 Tax=Cyphomyrmex costatus TaxID=456900 RepID=UPI00085242B8|nr:PREDICTED: uncharacterized protein K02A2.6-like [Cyphomyrmex costatus]